MLEVLLGLEDASFAADLARELSKAGHSVESVAPLETGPGDGVSAPNLVIVDGDARGLDLAVMGAAWAQTPEPPLLVVLTARGDARMAADKIGATVITKPIAPERLVAEVLRISRAPRGNVGTGAAGALAAMGLAAGGLPEDEAAAIVAGSRRVALSVVREGLRALSGEYITTTPMLDTLCARRALNEAEAEFATNVIDGAHRLGRLIDGGGWDQEKTARLLWALICGGAAVASHEPSWTAPHPVGRLCARTRAHLLARYKRVKGATPYDVLEIEQDCQPIDVEHAAVMLGLRFQPERMEAIDLGEFAPLAPKLWKQILDARATLADPLQKRKYDEFRPRYSAAEHAERKAARTEAEAAFLRGQRAMVGNDAFKAISELAAAARRYPEDPDYDVWAAWARTVAEVARGTDRVKAATRDRKAAEEALLGRRPRPRSLLALGLLCEAAGDRDFARMHFQEALAIDPRMNAAQQGLTRMGPG